MARILGQSNGSRHELQICSTAGDEIPIKQSVLARALTGISSNTLRATQTNTSTLPPMEALDKAAIVRSLAEAKERSGKTYSQIAAETGLTNVYVAQLLRRQAQLKPDTAPKLRKAVPALSDELVNLMMAPPFRSYHPDIIQEPAIYRLNEAVMHFGESIKEIINEEFGDGIMSAIDFFCSVDKVQGVDGKERVVVTFDGKYLPHTEQRSEHMVSRLRREAP